MDGRQEEWLFLRARAAQLFEEGSVRAALRLMERINREQIRLLEEANMNETKIVSTQTRRVLKTDCFLRPLLLQ